MTIVAGAVAGILGITGWSGFFVYLLSQALCTVPIVALAAASEGEARARRRRARAPGPGPPPLAPGPLAFVVPRCFQAWSQVLTEHVFGQTAILSYILCWMVTYNLAHVF